MSAYEEDRQHWIVFDSVSNFKVDGGGTFNGNGKKWWQNSCKYSNNNLVSSFCTFFFQFSVIIFSFKLNYEKILERGVIFYLTSTFSIR